MARKLRAKQQATGNTKHLKNYSFHVSSPTPNLVVQKNNHYSYSALMKKKVKCHTNSKILTNVQRKYRVRKRLSSSENLQLEKDKLDWRNYFNKCMNCVFFLKKGTIDNDEITIAGDYTSMIAGYNTILIGARSTWTLKGKVIESKKYTVQSYSFDDVNTIIKLNKDIVEVTTSAPIFMTNHVKKKPVCNVKMEPVYYVRHQDNCPVVKNMNTPSYKDIRRGFSLYNPCEIEKNAGDSHCASSGGGNNNFLTSDGCFTIGCRAEPNNVN
jgi:hypothetical protein